MKKFEISKHGKPTGVSYVDIWKVKKSFRKRGEYISAKDVVILLKNINNL